MDLFNFLMVFMFFGVTIPRTLGLVEDVQNDQRFHFQVSLRRGPGGVHFCEGALITKRWVLTSAKCVSDKLTEPIYVYAGSRRLDVSSQGYPTSRAISHPSYSSKTQENNIALLQLTSDIQYTNNILNVRLPQQNQQPTGPAIHSAWLNGQANLKTVSNIEVITTNCTSPFNGAAIPLHVNEICAKGEYIEGDGSLKCLSDFGSLLTKDQVLIGLFSREGCSHFYLDTFTVVSGYSNWIKSTLGDEGANIKWNTTYSGGEGDKPDGPGYASISEPSKLLILFFSSIYVLFRIMP